MRVVNNAPTCPYIIPYEGHQMLREQRAYRFATPVADFGTMWDTLKWVDDNKIPPWLPKAFLHDCFSALAQAGKFMIERNMLHNDLKTENILMVPDVNGDMGEFAHETDKKATGWGIKPAITDFGLARPVDSQAFQNPKDFLGFGTAGFAPPEQVRPKHETSSVLRGHVVSEKAAVFMLGCVMFEIMHPWQPHKPDQKPLARPWQFQNYSPKYLESHEVKLHHANLYRTRYKRSFNDKGLVRKHFRYHKQWRMGTSKILRTLIAKCLSLHPKNRPTFDELIEQLAESRGTQKQSQNLWIGLTIGTDNWNQAFNVGASLRIGASLPPERSSPVRKSGDTDLAVKLTESDEE